MGKHRETSRLFLARDLNFQRLICAGNGRSIMVTKAPLLQDIFGKAVISIYSNALLNRNVV